jgi:hypothetical protein
MNVEQLRRVLAEIPGDVPIVIDDCQMGWMANAALYLAPAHVDCSISGNYLRARHRDDAENCHALLISGLGQIDPNIVDITPQTAWPAVIDVEADLQASWESGSPYVADHAAPEARGDALSAPPICVKGKSNVRQDDSRLLMSSADCSRVPGAQDAGSMA